MPNEKATKAHEAAAQAHEKAAKAHDAAADAHREAAQAATAAATAATDVAYEACAAEQAAYDAMVDEHVAEIERVFGPEALDIVDVGWGDNGSSICSNIPGRGFLSTDYDPDTFAVLGHRAEWL